MKATMISYDKWISLKTIGNYRFSHESRCDGKIISVLPYRKGNTDYEFLFRKELTPCWSGDYNACTVTGGVEEPENPMLDAVRELAEETGYIVCADDLIDLGTSFGIKSSDSIYFLYSVDLTHAIQGDTHPSGKLEEREYCTWGDGSDIIKCKDPFAASIYLRLMNYLSEMEPENESVEF